MDVAAEHLTFAVDVEHGVSARLFAPDDATACLVFAHGAGAGMTHPFMEAVAIGLARRRVASLRFQFPSMERGSRRPDRPALAQAAVRAAVAEASRRMHHLPLVAGGKSFGGRMTSQAQSEAPLPRVEGLVFFGFPLHQAGKPATARSEHLGAVSCPMLFLQGSRDALADLRLLRPVCERLGTRATLTVFEDADHGFHVPVRSGKQDADVLEELVDHAARWIHGVCRVKLP